MNGKSKYSGLKSLGLILLLGALVFGGLGMTGVAAQAAIPGDTLYGIKSTIEQTRLSFAQDAGQRAELRLGFAEKRLQEIEALIAEGRYHEVSAAALAFEADLHGAILELETISRLDPARGSQIALEITSALTRFSRSLSEMASSAPESVRTDVERALDTTAIADSLDLSSIGSLGDDNSNVNSNANDNDDANGNDDDANANENDDANVNDDNSNMNGSDDCVSDGTAGVNINGDDSCTPGGDDNSNSGNDNSSVGPDNTNGDDHGGSSGGNSGSGGSGSDDGGNSGSGGGGGGGDG